ncbi:ABC transporter permease [Actinomyces urogenitalis]|uniref:ABC transporter permease n=1 Tax=Actinomyces urogenitalis TaxID=103621 RepID=UPI002432CF66|nr:ABC transporter permease [Actinomyces urogenitalis]MCI7456083.1 ABC transporter permease [Actinomyces urogenitalis]
MKAVVRKLGFYLFTAWSAITINFFIPRLVPGDPVQSLMNRYQGQLSTDAIHSLYVLFGLDANMSLWDQYVQYWDQLFHGDLGLSFTFFPTPVMEVVLQSLPWTIGLVGVATGIAFVAGTVTGIFLGWRRGTWADALIPFTTFFSCVPYFWIGLIAIAVFAVAWPILPSAGGYDTALMPSLNPAFLSSVVVHAVLPALTIVLSSVAGWILGMRNMMVTVSSEDYVTVAHAKGLSDRRVMMRYAARNAILPQVSGFSLSLGFVVGGTLVMEMVFSYPGIGYVLFQAVQAKDYPLMQGVFLVITFSVLVANILADVVYAVLDPRTRNEA